LIRRRIFDPAARRPPLEGASIFFSFHETLSVDALGLQITARSVSKDSTHRLLVMAVSTLPNTVYFESSHEFPVGASLESPTIPQELDF
jgi:hypothetical protein